MARPVSDADIPGKRHHYVPASYLGRFSGDKTKRYRRRPLYVARRGVERVFRQSAENLAFQHDLYALAEPDPSWLGPHIDCWGYEKSLPAALDMLVNRARKLDTKTWLHTLVPFVAGLFVRGPDANQGVNNEGRIIEFQELLAPVMAARWNVLHYPSIEPLITSDRTYAYVESPVGEGIALPIDTSATLLLTYAEKRRIATTDDCGWTTAIRHVDLGRTDAQEMRAAIATYAREAVYGADPVSVGEVSKAIGSAKGGLPSVIATPDGCDLLCHVYDYFRACSAVNGCRDDAPATLDRIDWDALSVDWSTPVAVALLFVERTRGGLYLARNALMIDLSFGVAIRSMRKTLKDFRRGAYGVFPIRHLRDNRIFLGDQWKQGPSGSEGYTEMSPNASGPTQLIDLGRLRRDLGYPL